MLVHGYGVHLDYDECEDLLSQEYCYPYNKLEHKIEAAKNVRIIKRVCCACVKSMLCNVGA